MNTTDAMAAGLRIAASDARLAANEAHREGNHQAAAMARTLAAEFTRTAEKYEADEVAA